SATSQALGATRGRRRPRGRPRSFLNAPAFPCLDTRHSCLDREFLSVRLRQIVELTTSKSRLIGLMENNTAPSSAGLPRRDFIKKTATVAAAVASTSLLKTPIYGQNQAPSAGVTGANNRIAVGFIGVGGQGMAH